MNVVNHVRLFSIKLYIRNIQCAAIKVGGYTAKLVFILVCGYEHVEKHRIKSSAQYDRNISDHHSTGVNGTE